MERWIVDTMLEHVGRIVAAVGVPVTADLEAGYGDTGRRGRHVARAVEVGAVGRQPRGPGAAASCSRSTRPRAGMAAARAAAPAGTFVINARTDTWFGEARRVMCSTRRSSGRCGTSRRAPTASSSGRGRGGHIRRLAEAVPAPLNVVAGLTASVIDAPTLFSLGVKRVSLGGSLARAALSFLERAGRELLDSGTLGFLDGAVAYADLQRRFGP